MSKKRLQLKGIGASKWIAIGKAHMLGSTCPIIPRHWLTDREVHNEKERFRKAIGRTQAQLQKIKIKLRKIQGKEEVMIIESYEMIAKDTNLIDMSLSIITNERINAEWALEKTVSKIKIGFMKTGKGYLNDRQADLDHVVNRIIRNLVGEEEITSKHKFDKDTILIAHDISPADTTQLVKGSVGGFVTELGGMTSHTSILARSFEIPAVVGTKKICGLKINGSPIIVDGIGGKVIINPTAAELKKYEELKKKYEYIDRILLKESSLPAETKDGVKIKLLANIELIEELPVAKSHGASGIGLFRTEVIYLKQQHIPTEEEQFEIYKEVLEKTFPNQAIIRTLDIGGDKFAGDAEIVENLNPAMGLKSIRLCLHNKDLFKTQLRALLRASIYGDLGIMIPMITNIEEIRRVKNILEEVKNELKKEKIEFNAGVRLGIMIEVPSAALTADSLASEVDFFSIGTNDLIQYTLAIDRGNEHVAYMYEPFHPAVIQLIKLTIDAAKRKKIDVSVCGEIAGDPHFLPVLIGLGLKKLSMGPYSIPRIKKVLRQLDSKRVKELVKIALTSQSSTDIKQLIHEETKKIKGFSYLSM